MSLKVKMQKKTKNRRNQEIFSSGAKPKNHLPQVILFKVNLNGLSDMNI
jgi:hypothetical protein